MEFTPERALVITPHPDDAEVWAGGVISKMGSRGRRSSLRPLHRWQQRDSGPGDTSVRVGEVTRPRTVGSG